MIGGTSGALQGLSVQHARFEQAAARMVATTAEGASPDATAIGAGATGMVDATVQMAVAQYALLSTLRAARTSNEMVAEMIRTM